jgi:hypothetical protein
MSRVSVNKTVVGTIRCEGIYPKESPNKTVGIKLSSDDAFRLAVKLMVACREGYRSIDLTAFRATSQVTVTSEQS